MQHKMKKAFGRREHCKEEVIVRMAHGTQSH
jgi:hypothetical protein